MILTLNKETESEHETMIKGLHQVKLGLERLLEERADTIRGARVGLVCNQASVDHQFDHAADIFDRHPDVNLRALFGPQHGIRGDVQDNMNPDRPRC